MKTGKRAKRLAILFAGIFTLVTLTLCLFLPRRVLWVEIGRYPWFRSGNTEMIRETTPETVLACPVYGDRAMSISIIDRTLPESDVRPINYTYEMFERESATSRSIRFPCLLRRFSVPDTFAVGWTDSLLL